MTLAIFTDFDETVTRVNVTDTVLEKFADPSWRTIQDEWLAGKLSAREVLQRQMPLLAVPPDELHALVDSLEVDPSFSPFVEFCRAAGHSIYVVSDGFDYWIRRMLDRALGDSGGEPGLSIFACGMTLHPCGVKISFPYFPDGCAHGCATCKPGLFSHLKGDAQATVVIGDGRSDFLLSRDADWVFAKGALRTFCLSERIPHEPFDDFTDVLEKIHRIEGRRRPQENDPGRA